MVGPRPGPHPGTVWYKGRLYTFSRVQVTRPIQRPRVIARPKPIGFYKDEKRRTRPITQRATFQGATRSQTFKPQVQRFRPPSQPIPSLVNHLWDRANRTKGIHGKIMPKIALASYYRSRKARWIANGGDPVAFDEAFDKIDVLASERALDLDMQMQKLLPVGFEEITTSEAEKEKELREQIVREHKEEKDSDKLRILYLEDLLYGESLTPEQRVQAEAELSKLKNVPNARIGLLVELSKDKRVDPVLGFVDFLTDIPVDKLVPGEETFAKEHVGTKFAGKTKGPIEVIYSPSKDNYQIINGHHRWAEAKARGDESITGWVSIANEKRGFGVLKDSEL